MASLIDELIDTLEKENEAYQKLLELSMEKTGTIINGKVDRLSEIVEQEQILITNEVQPLEKKRQECTSDIATVINKKLETLTLTALAELMTGQPETKRRICSIHDKLHDTMSQMTKVNDMNKVLLQESIELVEFDINLMKGLRQAPITANYNKNAYNVGEPMRMSGAFDKSQ